ncbi:MAG: aminopeptidase P N-terminal domain-containing protein [Thiobacillaceae bacterium]
MELRNFLNRRERLREELQDGVAILANGPEVTRTRDSQYPYRFDSYFHYLTAFPEPEAVCVVVAGKSPRSVLFCRDKDAEREIWDGYRFGPDAAREAFGFDEAHSLSQLDLMLPDLLANQSRLAYLVGETPGWDARVLGWLNAVRAKARTGIMAPEEILDVRRWLDEMRLVKDAAELDIMRGAGRISSNAHRRAMVKTRPGIFEYEIEAELLHEFVGHGARHQSYSSIVAGGANACVLHYVENTSMLKDGDLLLIDAGCELEGYASDITRTFPVNGKFSAAQRAVYEVVLAAQLAAIASVNPGARWNQPHEVAVRVLTEGMVDLKLLIGDIDGLIEQGAYKRFYMHRTGHWLGRDVHDAGAYKESGEWRELRPGMVLTVEPGLYLGAADDIPVEFQHIGIRIEDDVAVTDSGSEVLTNPPKSVTDIEDIMSHG